MRLVRYWQPAQPAIARVVPEGLDFVSDQLEASVRELPEKKKTDSKTAKDESSILFTSAINK